MRRGTAVRFGLTLRLTSAWLLVSILLAGCQSQPASSEASKPRITGVVYYTWAGMSPGGGFTRTSLTATEVDLDAKRARGLSANARAPDPMLPYSREKVQELLSERPWEQLPSDHHDRLTSLVHDWLRTDPPATYNIPRGLGLEDGHAEVMMVTMDSGEHITSVNPRGGFSPSDPLAPPPQWVHLVKFLVELRVKWIYSGGRWIRQEVEAPGESKP